MILHSLEGPSQKKLSQRVVEQISQQGPTNQKLQLALAAYIIHVTPVALCLSPPFPCASLASVPSQSAPSPLSTAGCLRSQHHHMELPLAGNSPRSATTRSSQLPFSFAAALRSRFCQKLATAQAKKRMQILVRDGR